MGAHCRGPRGLRRDGRKRHPAAMNYLSRDLIEGERVVFTARPHRVGLLLPALGAGAALSLAFLAWLDGTLGAAASLFAVPAFAAVPSWLRWRSTQYVVTNKRLCVRTGVLKVTTLETVLNKVGTIGVEQDLPGRALGYGTVIIKGLGGGVEALPRIADPYRLRRMVHIALAG